MNSVCVNVSAPYRILFERGGLKRAGSLIKDVTRAKKLLVVSDTNVAPLYLAIVSSSLSGEGFDVSDFVIEAGEQSKSTKTYLSIIDALASRFFKRTDAVVALGGGVVGDIAGFAAATYMRGIDVVQIPTTLLAMTDSAIGGKTGVDLPQGKNLLGAFHQPKLVLADTDVLSTLPHREWQNGLGEGAKYACLAGGRIAELMADGDIKNHTDEFIELCAGYKAKIVAADEKEGGLRALLNLGHTVGHAMEKLSGFQIPHGVAVANGVAIMARSAFMSGGLCENDYKNIQTVLHNVGVTELPKIDGRIFDLIAMDKKASGASDISAVVIHGLGDCRIQKMSFEEFKAYIG